MRIKLLSVAEASRVADVSPDTIRRWEKKGLIKAHRSPLNHRLFDVDEVRRVNQKVLGHATAKEFKILKSKEKSKYSVIELFAGAGGTALGFHNAGLQHVLLTDWDKDATETLRRNIPEWTVIRDDIKNIDFSAYTSDIIEGGFPCQSFSYAGKKRGFEDTRGTMFFEFARSVKEVQPKIAIGENVRGLLRHDDGKTLATICRVLQDAGYRVAYHVLRAQYFDVPQKRERLVIIAVRNDIDTPILFPKERDYTVSIREALKHCPSSPGQMYPPKKKSILERIPQGGYWKDLPIALQKKYMGASFYMGGGKTGMARRLAWDEPSLTLTCAPAQKQTERCHPEETRPLTVREYARIQTFPDSWQFTGSISSQYKQIGNAVPTNLAFHIAKCAIAMLDGKLDPKTMIEVSPLAQ
jgi:DNA (cytosine-5)-methyltransferase 1